MELPTSQENEVNHNDKLTDFAIQLRTSSPSGRAFILLRELEEHPETLLELASKEDERLCLDDINLSSAAVKNIVESANTSPVWWDSMRECVVLRQAILQRASLVRANLQGVDLREADLSNARLVEANLSGTLLEQANLKGADLASANLSGAVLGEANLQGAMLEEADLTGANLRFANLTDTVFEGAQLVDADLWGAKAAGVILTSANLKNVNFRETYMDKADCAKANLQGAILNKTVLTNANLRGADLQGATLTSVNLESAVLSESRLQGVVLSDSNIKHVFFCGARFSKTEFEQPQIGQAIGEDLAGEFEAARSAYLSLERNFQELGDQDAAGWAYGKRRRMQKLAALHEARKGRSSGNIKLTLRYYAKYISNQLVEWLCDYGESMSRVLATMMLVYVLFTIIYGLTGSVVRVTANGSEMTRVVTYDPLELAIFSLLAMTTSGSPVVGLLPTTEMVHILTGIQALAGIFLTGLLGFVAGNRIRR